MGFRDAAQKKQFIWAVITAAAIGLLGLVGQGSLDALAFELQLRRDIPEIKRDVGDVKTKIEAHEKEHRQAAEEHKREFETIIRLLKDQKKEGK